MLITGAGRLVAYDLGAHPGELWPEAPTPADRALVSTPDMLPPRRRQPRRRLPADAVERLRALGYLGVPSTPAAR